MYEGTEREHTCDRLTPGHTYRVRVAACSAGGRSEVITLMPRFFAHKNGCFFPCNAFFAVFT